MDHLDAQGKLMRFLAASPLAARDGVVCSIAARADGTVNFRRQHVIWMQAVALITAMAAAAPTWPGVGTVPGHGLGIQTTRYVQQGSAETTLDWPFGVKPILRLRTYYFDAESLTNARSVAWTFGGWGGMTTVFLGDVFQMGAIGYTSQRLYGPEDKGGTKLLVPPQEPFTVLGEAFAAIRLFELTFVGYRQLVNRPFVNKQDNRTVPIVMEDYTLRGAPGDWSYVAGYLTKIEVRDSEADSTTGSPLPNQYETDVRADYAFPLPKDHVLHGQSATVRYSWLHQDGAPQTAQQLRAYLNYEVTFR